MSQTILLLTIGLALVVGGFYLYARTPEPEAAANYVAPAHESVDAPPVRTNVGPDEPPVVVSITESGHVSDSGDTSEPEAITEAMLDAMKARRDAAWDEFRVANDAAIEAFGHKMDLTNSADWSAIAKAEVDHVAASAERDRLASIFSATQREFDGLLRRWIMQQREE